MWSKFIVKYKLILGDMKLWLHILNNRFKTESIVENGILIGSLYSSSNDFYFGGIKISVEGKFSFTVFNLRYFFACIFVRFDVWGGLILGIAFSLKKLSFKVTKVTA